MSFTIRCLDTMSAFVTDNMGIGNNSVSLPCWVVERTFGWLMGCRRLVRDYELLPATSETFIYLAMIRIMVQRLA
jgi:hypothetical protein